MDYLMMLVEHSPSMPFKPETGPEYMCVYLLSHLGLTEHGSSIRIPWITSKGLTVLGFLLRNGYDWCDREWIDADNIHRGTIK